MKSLIGKYLVADYADGQWGGGVVLEVGSDLIVVDTGEGMGIRRLISPANPLILGLTVFENEAAFNIYRTVNAEADKEAAEDRAAARHWDHARRH